MHFPRAGRTPPGRAALNPTKEYEMKAASIISIREKRGAPQLWLENLATERSGFVPGATFTVTPYRKGVLLSLAEDGGRRVSKKDRGTRVVPVIDINAREALAPIADYEAVRVVYGERMIYVAPLASEIRRLRRLARLRAHLAQSSLDTAGLACGGGVMTHAVHAGLSDAGLGARTLMFNEIRADLAEHAMAHNDALSADTVIANLPLQELAFDEEVMRRMPEVDLLEMGLPCSGASRSGKAKNKNALPEDHPLVGYLIAGAIAVTAKLNPAVVIAENVPLWGSSASAAILRGQLRDLGYQVSERVLEATDWGEMEARKRWFMVAVTEGIAFDFEAMMPKRYPIRYLAEIMEEIPDDDPRWSPMQYLRDKEVRDRNRGANFKMQLFDGSEIHIGTLTKGLQKRRSTDPMFQHPERPELLRLPTVTEHARCKGIPEHLVAGLSQTKGHELLGQSIAYGPVRAIAAHLGQALRAFAETEVRARKTTFACAA